MIAYLDSTLALSRCNVVSSLYRMTGIIMGTNTMTIEERLTKAAASSTILAGLDSASKNRALLHIREQLLGRKDEILSANTLDMARAEQEQLAEPLKKRLRFNIDKLSEVCQGIVSMEQLPDPANRVMKVRELDKGLDLYQITCPIGLIAMIFESRPDALVQIACLALKSGNALVLKGGSEAFESNRALFTVIHEASVAAGLPEGWMVLLESREDIKELLQYHKLVDLVIPRGSNEFVQYIMKNTLIPVMGHADGICHAYVHASADIQMAARLVLDSKTQYVAVCNALETLLVDVRIAEQALPVIAAALATKNVELRGCPRTAAIIDCKAASAADWETEYLDYILAIKVVDSQEEAMAHIHRYGSKHTELFIGSDAAAARLFMTRVDAAGVYWNASTRFADGFKYGLGAEVGISTGKLHARGPVGLEGLVSYKYKLFGNGNIAEDYANGTRQFTHVESTSTTEPWS